MGVYTICSFFYWGKKEKKVKESIKMKKSIIPYLFTVTVRISLVRELFALIVERNAIVDISGDTRRILRILLQVLS